MITTAPVQPGGCLWGVQHAQLRKKVPAPPEDSIHVKLKALELARPSLSSAFLPNSYQPLPSLLPAMLSVPHTGHLSSLSFLGTRSLTPLLPLELPVLLGTHPHLPGDCLLLHMVMGWGWTLGHCSRIRGGPGVALSPCLWGPAECLGSACLAPQHSSAWPRQSCSNNAKLLVILHMLQALSHFGDFVPMSLLPASCSVYPRLTLPHLKRTAPLDG